MMKCRRIYHGVRAARVRDWLAPCLAIAFCYIAGNVALMLTALQIAVSAIASLIPALFLEGDYVLTSTSMTAWGIIIYLAIACTLAGFALQNFALTRIAPRTVSLIQCTCPVATAFFSYVLLGEKLSMLGMAGAMLILACVTISVWQEVSV